DQRRKAGEEEQHAQHARPLRKPVRPLRLPAVRDQVEGCHVPPMPGKTAQSSGGTLPDPQRSPAGSAHIFPTPLFSPAPTAMPALAALQTALRQRIGAAGERPFAVLDFDNTCIVNDIAEAVLAHMCRNDLLRYRGLLARDTPPDEYPQRVFRHYYALLAQGD